MTKTLTVRVGYTVVHPQVIFSCCIGFILNIAQYYYMLNR